MICALEHLETALLFVALGSVGVTAGPSTALPNTDGQPSLDLGDP
ncbi:MAG: hypothetical protein ACYDGN_16550 [Acidimicrobiales bacterium]